MPKHFAEDKPHNEKAKPGDSARKTEEENRRQAKVIPFPEKREEKPTKDREKK